MSSTPSDPELQIRQMMKEEIEIFYNICKTSSLELLTMEQIENVHRGLPETLLVAVVSREIVGTCFASKTKRLISVLEAGSHCTDPLNIQIALLEEAIRRLAMAPIEITVSSRMNSYMRAKEYKHRWDIHLYAEDSEKIVPPKCNFLGYKLDINVGSYGGPFALKIVAPNGIYKYVKCSETRQAPPIVTLKLHDELSTNYVGCGGIIRTDEGKLLIGPLFAPEENAARVILRLLILFIKKMYESTVVLMYVVNRCETRRFLEDAHFSKLDPEWSRYSTDNRTLLQYFTLDDFIPVTHALSSIAFSVI